MIIEEMYSETLVNYAVKLVSHAWIRVILYVMKFCLVRIIIIRFVLEMIIVIFILFSAIFLVSHTFSSNQLLNYSTS